MALTGNIRKCWTLRKTEKQEPYQGGNLLRRQRASYQWNILQVTRYLETNTLRKQSKENNFQNYNIIKLSPQRSATKYGSIQVRKGHIQKIFIWPNVFGYRLGIAKISYKNLNSFLSYPEKT